MGEIRMMPGAAENSQRNPVHAAQHAIPERMRGLSMMRSLGTWRGPRNWRVSHETQSHLAVAFVQAVGVRPRGADIEGR